MPSPLKRGMPWPLSRNVRPFWVPGRHLEQDAALQGRDRDLAPEQRLAQRDRHLALEVVAACA